MRTDDCDQLIALLHQWIENRSINVACEVALDNFMAEDGLWQFVDSEDQTRAFHIIDTADKIVRMNGDELRECMETLRTAT